MSAGKFNIFSFTGKMKILHLSWFIFFVSFVVWFNLAPMLQAIQDTFALTKPQVVTLLILNVALTIPARVIIGMLTDKYGPRLVYSTLMVIMALPCFAFAFAETYTQLAIARFLLGCIGAGFVIGIRMVSEWFPHKELGTAEGIYGGWGNFGSAAAAFTLPTIALMFGGEEGWRYAIAITGVLSLFAGVMYYFNTSDTPKGSTYFKPKHMGSMEITSKGDFFFLILMKIPMYLALGILAWRLSPSKVDMLSQDFVNIIYAVLVAIFMYDLSVMWKVNKKVFTETIPAIHQYKFKQVAVLNVLYFATFGSELAVVSMLPLFFSETFSLSPVMAGMLASGYAFMNLMSRPGGGIISDKFGRKKTLLVLTAGLAVGYFLMSQVESSWSLVIAVAAVMACSFFVQAGEGAVFAVVPLIKRSQTGQIAGMTGAYGNVGAVTYLLVYSMVDAHTFFMVIAATAVLGFLALLFLEEPKGEIAEIDEYGQVQMIQVG
jgi:NNP family nitrate/nitrite transporter-like MFS transporter